MPAREITENPSTTWRLSRLPAFRSVGALTAQHDQNERAQDQYRGGACKPYDVSNQQPVLSRNRIILVAKKQKLVDRRAELTRGGLNEGCTQNARRKSGSVLVSRSSSRRRQKQQAGST